MWGLYSRVRDGIAIKTDFNSLSECFVGEDDVFIGRVNYIDYSTTFIREDNTLAPYLNKRRSFEHENEVRAINQVLPVRDGKIDLSEDTYDVGAYFDVDLSLLVKDVIVAPYAEDWFLELVQAVTRVYNLDVPVRRSDLAESPTWDQSDDPTSKPK